MSSCSVTQPFFLPSLEKLKKALQEGSIVHVCSVEAKIQPPENRNETLLSSFKHHTAFWNYSKSNYLRLSKEPEVFSSPEGTP